MGCIFGVHDLHPPGSAAPSGLDGRLVLLAVGPLAVSKPIGQCRTKSSG